MEPYVDLTLTVERIVQNQRQRRFLMQAESRCTMSAKAFTADRFREYSTRVYGKEVKRKAAFDLASSIQRAVHRRAEYEMRTENAKNQNEYARYADKTREINTFLEPHADFLKRFQILDVITMSLDSREPWTQRRNTTERGMRELARQLPVWEWVECIRGISDKGLAVIVGETGDLFEYPTNKKVHRRLGLAVLDGRRQGDPFKVTDYAWHGYKPSRRAEVWVFLDDILYNQQAMVSPVGYYAQLCRDHKLYQVERNEAG
jgi:hypothetical protein